MASPQCENGYTKIANELLEAACKRITNATWLRIFFYTVRITYGFHVKERETNYKAYMTKLNLSDETIRNTMLEMTDRKILVSKFVDNRTLITGVNKNYEQWKV
jgi:phage replication O-like protein O